MYRDKQMAQMFKQAKQKKETKHLLYSLIHVETFHCNDKAIFVLSIRLKQFLAEETLQL